MVEKTNKVIEAFPEWQKTQKQAVNINKRLKPWVMDTFEIKDREFQALIVPVLKDLFPGNFFR